MRSATRNKTGRDPDYLAFIRRQPCICCERPDQHTRPLFTRLRRYMNVNRLLTEAAHVGMRGMGQKASDREAIPLCSEHHRTGPDSHHVLGRKFWSRWGLDRNELIANYQEAYAKTQPSDAAPATGAR
jgi:hypothetical protein